MANRVTMPSTLYEIVGKRAVYDHGVYRTEESPPVQIRCVGAVTRADVRAALDAIGFKLRRTDRFEAVPLKREWYSMSAEKFLENAQCIRTETISERIL